MAADPANLVGKPVSNVTIDPSGASKNNQLMQPNAKDDPQCINDTNDQKAWFGGSGKPSAPYGQQGHNF
jgi:hypothetical protein